MAIASGWTLWLTGLPAAGKSTIARALLARLREQGGCAVLLDSDELRALLQPTGAYSDEERAEFYLRLVRLAVYRHDRGVAAFRDPPVSGTAAPSTCR